MTRKELADEVRSLALAFDAVSQRARRLEDRQEKTREDLAALRRDIGDLRELIATGQTGRDALAMRVHALEERIPVARARARADAALEGLGGPRASD